MSLIDVTIAEIIQESPSVKSFRLVRADGEPLGTYLPGAHIDVTAPNAITRQYSLCSTPEAGDMFTVAVKREDDSRGGSAALHELSVGDRLRISAPRNLLGIAEGAAHHVLIAAGIGITPLLSMARYMDVHDIGFELHYFARSAEEAAFLPLLQDRCPEKLHAHLGIPRADQDAVLEAMLAAAPEGSHAYVCGPVGFMQKVVDLAEGHLPPHAVHREDFHAAPLPDASENTAFEVELEDEVYEGVRGSRSSRSSRRTAATSTPPARRACAGRASCRCWPGIRSIGTASSLARRRPPGSSSRPVCPARPARGSSSTTTERRRTAAGRFS